jgi:hypothetical protein
VPQDASLRAKAGGVPRLRGLLPLGISLVLCASASAEPDPGAGRAADPLPTVVDLQTFRRTASIPIDDGAGRRGRATLVDLAPAVHAWLLLTLDWEGARGETLHLENPDPRHQRVSLEAASPHGLVLTSDSGLREACELWSGAGEGLATARRSTAPFAPLCGERLYLRR